MPASFMNDPALKNQNLVALLAHIQGKDTVKRNQILKGLHHIFYLTNLYTRISLGIDTNPLNKPEESTRDEIG